MLDRVSTVKFGLIKINSTSGFLKDSVPNVGFRSMAFTRAIGLREHKTTITWLPMWLPIDCVQEDLYLCVHDQCSRTVTIMKTKQHLMLKPYYILHLPYSYPTGHINIIHKRPSTYKTTNTHQRRKDENKTKAKPTLLTLHKQLQTTGLSRNGKQRIICVYVTTGPMSF